MASTQEPEHPTTGEVPGNRPPVSKASLLGPMISLGSIMATGVLCGGLTGYWMDRRYGTGRLWTVVGLFVGLFYGFYETWKLVRRIDPPRKP